MLGTSLGQAAGPTAVMLRRRGGEGSPCGRGGGGHECHQIWAKIWEMLLVSPSSWKTLTLKAVPGMAGTHPRLQPLWLDSIKAFTASDMTASDLQ